jgi:hypothetical protein
VCGGVVDELVYAISMVKARAMPIRRGKRTVFGCRRAAAVNEMVLYADDIHAPHRTAPHSRKQDVVRRSQRDGGTPQKPRDGLDMAGIARMAYIL